jgi:hypothetical protein
VGVHVSALMVSPVQASDKYMGTFTPVKSSGPFAPTCKTRNMWLRPYAGPSSSSLTTRRPHLKEAGLYQVHCDEFEAAEKQLIPTDSRVEYIPNCG